MLINDEIEDCQARIIERTEKVTCWRCLKVDIVIIGVGVRKTRTEQKYRKSLEGFCGKKERL